MDKSETFANFLTTHSPHISLPVLGMNLIISAILSFFVARVYIKYGRAVSNRRIFSDNFMLMATTTVLIITVVKSSLALSLGLVGALSIVRFRAAIKDPEELSYLFLNISIGLGLGADQTLITVGSTALILLLIVIKGSLRKSIAQPNLFLSISSGKVKDLDLEKVVSILKDFCSSLSMKRYDSSNQGLEMVFLVEFAGYEQLNKSRAALEAIDPSILISFMDSPLLSS